MKKKILFLLQVPPPVHGASLRNVSLVNSHLLREHFNIFLLPMRFADEIDDIGKVSLLKFWRLLKFLVALIYQLIFFKPQFTYFTISPIGMAFYRDVIIVTVIKLFRVPLVYHLRGLGIHEASKSAVNGFFYRYAFRGTAVICLSENHTKDIMDLPYKRKFVVPDGIKVEVDDVVLYKDRPIRDVPEILFLSNYVKSKGVYDFLSAMRILNEKRAQFTVRMIGAEWDVTMEEMNRIAIEYGLTGRITIDKPIFGKEKFEAILNTTIFAFPTFYELFPGVVLESMQCGKAVVTTITGAIPEMIDNGLNGLLVNTHDPEALAEKVNLLLNDPTLREKLGQEARKKFMTYYTLEKYEANMKQTFDLITETL